VGTLEAHGHVQTIAKNVLAGLRETIVPGDSELTIATRAVEYLANRGITETWYYECPAFVLLGPRSTLSLSGRDYRPADEPAGMCNLITIDLSPSLDGVWGDCARTFIIEDGRCTLEPSFPEFRRGIEVQGLLHESLRTLATPELTFAGLYSMVNHEIEKEGFENLDFLKNLGHSIASHLDERCFIEAGNDMRLGEVPFFTFEPHIREKGSQWGFKHENIYYFDDNGHAREL
jgi:Xaa-Pro aminopeptidase